MLLTTGLIYVSDSIADTPSKYIDKRTLHRPVPARGVPFEAQQKPHEAPVAPKKNKKENLKNLHDATDLRLLGRRLASKAGGRPRRGVDG